MSADTTVQIRSALVSKPDEMQAAYNAFAVAVKNHIANPTPRTFRAMEKAQAELYRVEDLYREGRRLRLLHAWMQRAKERGA